MPFSLNEKPDGLTFNIRVQPRSSRNQVVGLLGDAIKINLTAPPVNNAANKACTVFLAGLLSVSKSSVTILAGHSGRNKRVLVRCPKGDGRRHAIKETIFSWATVGK